MLIRHPEVLAEREPRRATARCNSGAVHPSRPARSLSSGRAFARTRWLRRLRMTGWDRCALGRGPSLRPEHPVAGVAEAGQDVAVVVQPLVDRRGPDRHVGMLLLELRDALGGGEQADEADVAGAARFQQ